MSKFLTPFNRSKKSVLGNCVKFTKPSKVKSSLSLHTDINKIYEDYCREGRLPLNGLQPIYDENFVTYDSLVESEKIISESKFYFNSLPANIKSNYDNDVFKFIKAVNGCDKFLIDNGVLNIPNPVPQSSNVNIKDSIPPESASDAASDVNTVKAE